MRFSRPPHTSITAWISFLRRQVIVHSILYYEMDSPVVTDREYDRLCRMLVEECAASQEDADRADYHYCMHDFDGSTGFDIFSRLAAHDRNYLYSLAGHVRKLYKAEAVK